jgi:hypothetical protein
LKVIHILPPFLTTGSDGRGTHTTPQKLRRQITLSREYL